MSILVFPGHRARQPQQRAIVDVANPLARGLAFFIAPCGGPQLYDHVNGVFATPSRAQPTQIIQSTTQGSLASTFASASSDLQTLPDITTGVSPYNILTQEITLIWGGTITTGSAFRAFATKATPGGNGSLNCPFDFRTDSSASPKCVLVRANAVTNTQATATNAISVGVYHQVAVAVNPNAAMRFFIDGVVDVNASTMNITPTAVSSNLNIGRRQDGAVQMNGSFEFIAGWARTLSDFEVQQMYRNPWRMFSMNPRMRMVPQAAVGGGFFSRYYYDMTSGAANV